MIRRIKYSLRNIKRNKLNASITTVGLSIALASIFIIYLFVAQENSFNNFHKKADKIYRLNYNVKLKTGEEGALYLLDPKLAEELKDKIPQIEYCTPFRLGYMAQFDLDDKYMKVKLGIAEQDFFDMFSFDLLYGNKEKLLLAPTDIVLTKSMANKILKNNTTSLEELIGESIKFSFLEDTRFTITGILDDIPKNSSLDFEAIIPFEHQRPFWQSSNGFGNSSIFFEINSDANPEQANALISDAVYDYYRTNIEKAQKNNFLYPTEECFQPFMLPLKDVYLDNLVDTDYELRGNKAQLKILTIVGILILFIAFSNYIILTIGQFFKKSGEIGVRKSIGGKNIDIFKMFLSENAVLIIISFVLGGLLSYYLIPLFNNISQSQIYFNLINAKSFVSFLILSIILLIILTSIIPVFIFKKVKPVSLATKNIFTGKKSGSSRIFVGAQYTLTIVLIIATIVINKQTHFLKNKSLGFSEENIISIDVPYLSQSKSFIIRDILKKQAGVENVSLTNRNYFDGYSTCSFTISDTEILETYNFKADNFFIPTLDLKLIEGRNFSESEITENNKSIIVNEEFVSRMGFKGSAVGQIVNGCNDDYTIVGVVNDYQFLTSREKIEPMILHARTDMGNPYSAVFVKYDPKNLSNVISAIKSGWKEIDTKEQLNYIFWDKELESRYQAEERLSKIIMYASIIAITILTLGLFGLTVLISAQRTNEIGIRKVNGARIIEVIMLLNKDYLKWVLIAFILASPTAWFILKLWLEDFAFKTDISWWVFALAGTIALFIALLTVSFQSFKAASKNPVEALRYE